jgi:uncharacterized membrane protein YhaH (DUF805 family)
MPMTSQRVRFLVVLLCAFGYAVVGVAFGALANASTAAHGRAAWRVAAYAVSALLFASQFTVEYRRADQSPSGMAAYCALAVAVGAFALAAAAHLWTALVVWPLVTAVPAFVVAWAAGKLLTRRQARA